METTRLVLLAVASVGAGAVNSVAGGGSLLSFPALLAVGVPPVMASATNSVAIAPGSLAAAFAYRKQLGDGRRIALLLSASAALGALLGAVLLLSVPERAFELVVPWLVLGATLVLLGKDKVAAWTSARAAQPTKRRIAIVAALLCVLSIYGGYFGAGMGILTLAVLALLRRMNIHEMNAIKTLAVGSVNTAASIYFLTRGAVDLSVAGIMAAGALIGGYGGARLLLRVDPTQVRRGVVLFGLLLATYLALRALHLI